MKMKHNNRAWAEINLDAIENNIKAIRRYVTPSAKILGIVKADAYGHGYLEVARTLLENGADIHDIKEILGHADISSTQRYAQFLKDKMKNSYMKFHPRA